MDINLEKNSLDFILLPIGKRFLLIDKVKGKSEALDFINNLILGLHPMLTKKDNNIKHLARILSIAEKTRQALNHNGNVQLHLTNFIVNI